MLNPALANIPTHIASSLKRKFEASSIWLVKPIPEIGWPFGAVWIEGIDGSYV